MKELVKSFEEACARKGISTQLPDVSTFPENLQKHVTATYKLSVVLEVNNGDWKPDIANTAQWKYYPWFRITPGEGPSGFGLSFLGYVFDFSGSGLGARLACCSSDVAKFMGEHFTDLYKDLFI